MKSNVFITLEQFKAFAARVQAKNDWLRRILDKYALEPNDVVSGAFVLALFDELRDSIDKPSDFYVSQLDMSKPLNPEPTQLTLFGKEYC